MNFSDSDILKELDFILEADREIRIDSSRDDIISFAENVMVDDLGRNWKVARHHAEWYTLLENTDIKKLQIMSSRLHAKTAVMTAFLLYTIGKNPNIVIKYVCGDDNLAIDIVSMVSKNIENNKMYRDVFPHVVPGGEWSKHKIFVQRPAGLGLKDATIEAAGVMSSGTGGRCHLLILDDVVDSRVLREPARIPSIQRAIESDWLNLLWPGGRVILIGTPWSFEPPDVNVQYAADAKLILTPFNELNMLREIKSDDWVLWRGPAILEGGPVVTGEPISGTPMWPEKWPIEELEVRRNIINNDMLFNQQFMLEGMLGKANWFDELWIQKCTKLDIKLGEGIGEDWPVYMGVDPARSLEKGSSNSCIFVIAVAPDGTRIPIEIFVDKLDSIDLARKLISYYLLYKPILITVENNGYQKALIDLVNVLANDMGHLILPIIGQFTGTQKWSPEVGLPRIGAQMASGKWIIPRGGNHSGTEHKCPVCQWVQEMRKFGKERITADTIMAMWLADCAVEKSTLFMDLNPVAVVRRRDISGRISNR